MDLIHSNSRIFNGPTNEYTLKASKMFDAVKTYIAQYEVCIYSFLSNLTENITRKSVKESRLTLLNMRHVLFYQFLLRMLHVT